MIERGEDVIYRLFCASEHYADLEADLGLEMPEGHRGPVPRGQALTLRLIETLEGRRWSVPFRWATDFSHAFEVRGGGYRLDAMVTCLDIEAGQFEITAERRTGLIPFIRNRHPAVLRQLARHLLAALVADAAIFEARPADREIAELLGRPE